MKKSKKWLLVATLIAVSSIVYLLSERVQWATKLADGLEAYHVGNYAKAEKLLKPLADSGIQHAQLKIGEMYAHGRGVEKNYEIATYWFRKAAYRYEGVGDKAAYVQYWIGNEYETGDGVEKKDLQEALRWYRMSAEGGYPEAQKKLDTLNELVNN